MKRERMNTNKDLLKTVKEKKRKRKNYKRQRGDWNKKKWTEDINK